MEKHRNEAILCTFLMAGLRLQELLNLQVQDVDLESEEIFVRQDKFSGFTLTLSLSFV